MNDENFPRQTYREWLNNRFNDELEEEDPEGQPDELESDADDGYPLHDRYDEESSP